MYKGKSDVRGSIPLVVEAIVVGWRRQMRDRPAVKGSQPLFKDPEVVGGALGKLMKFAYFPHHSAVQVKE